MKTLHKLSFGITILAFAIASCKKDVPDPEMPQVPVDSRLQYVGSYSVVDSFSSEIYSFPTIYFDTVYYSNYEISLSGTADLQFTRPGTSQPVIFHINSMDSALINCSNDQNMGKITSTGFKFNLTDDSWACGSGPIGSSWRSNMTGTKL